MSDIFNDGILGEPTRGLEIRPPSSSRPSPSKGLKKLAAGTPSTNESSELREQILGWLEVVQEHAWMLGNQTYDMSHDTTVETTADAILSLIHHHDQRIIAEARKQAASDIFNLAHEYAKQDKTMLSSEDLRGYHYFNAIHKIGEFDGR